MDAARAALQQGSAPAPAEASHGEHSGKQESKEHQKELAVIRQQYLGTQKTKRRVAKASDKFRSAPHLKFVFIWLNFHSSCMGILQHSQGSKSLSCSHGDCYDRISKVYHAV